MLKADQRAGATEGGPSTVAFYGGVVAVTVTPCRSVGEIDAEAMNGLCRLLGGCGCHGVFVAGSTGDMPLLDEEDRRTLIVAAREALDARTTLYGGVTGAGIRQTIRYAKNAAADGADVAVLMAPGSLRFSQPELSDYARAVADASPIPVALYHHRRVPTKFGVETVAHLAEHPNIVAMKDTSVDMDRFARLIEATAGTGFSLLQGSERLIHDSLRLGGNGCVTALAGVAPEWHVALYRAFLDRSEQDAAGYQQRILGLCELFAMEEIGHSFSYFSYALKCVLRYRGWLESTAGMMGGFLPDESFEQRVREKLRAAGLGDVGAAGTATRGKPCRRSD